MICFRMTLRYVVSFLYRDSFGDDLMGYYINQCATDAWGVIQGRKKIVGNEIVNCENSADTPETENKDYGWLAPNGKFYHVDFGEHQAWAAQYLADEYRNGNIELKVSEEPGDVLTAMGFILLHNPHGYNFSITRDCKKRMTNKQKEFLIDYFNERNMDNWLVKLDQDDI